MHGQNADQSFIAVEPQQPVLVLLVACIRDSRFEPVQHLHHAARSAPLELKQFAHVAQIGQPSTAIGQTTQARTDVALAHPLAHPGQHAEFVQGRQQTSERIAAVLPCERLDWAAEQFCGRHAADHREHAPAQQAVFLWRQRGAQQQSQLCRSVRGEHAVAAAKRCIQAIHI